MNDDSGPVRYYLAVEHAVRELTYTRPLATWLLAAAPFAAAWVAAERTGHPHLAAVVIVAGLVVGGLLMQVHRSTRCGCGKNVPFYREFCRGCGRRHDRRPVGTWRRGEPRGPSDYRVLEDAVRRRTFRRPEETVLLVVAPFVLAWSAAETLGYPNLAAVVVLAGAVAALWTAVVYRSTRCPCGTIIESDERFCTSCGRRRDELPPGTWAGEDRPPAAEDAPGTDGTSPTGRDPD